MTVFSEKLKEAWGNKGITKAVFQQTPFDACKEGQLLWHNISESESLFDIIQTVYWDDGAFSFKAWENFVKGITLMKKTFESIGLEKYIGQENTPFKTGCIFFPQPDFYSSL